MAVCFLALQVTFAGIAEKRASALNHVAALCLNDNAVESTSGRQTPPAPAPLTHHHDSDCCFLNFSELSPGVIAVLASYLTPPPASKSKPPAHLFIVKFHSSPELSSSSPRAPPIARV